MFERRLKIFLWLIFAITVLLLARALHVQVIQSDQWREQAARSMRRPEYPETTRGSILDCKNRVIALDEPCVDACVDYRAIEREESWMKGQARARLAARLGDGWRRAERARREQLLEEELARVATDLDVMWATLAKVSGKTAEQIEQARQEIRQRVEMRLRYVWYWRYKLATQEYEENREPLPWYRQWLISGDDAPQLDSFGETTGEQAEAHVVLHDIPTETQNLLKMKLPQLPGLVLRPGVRRAYPYKDVACHVIGHLGPVNREDLEHDPNVGDDLRAYLRNDLIGRSGIEALCEQALRGSRGRVQRYMGRDDVAESVEAKPGRDVKMTLDIQLQAQTQKLFERLTLTDRDGNETVRQHLHGAAVVIDIPTAEVRALVSTPTFDLNQFEANYALWSQDEIENPLLNRATQAQYPPGSTVKPIVGIGAITGHFIRPDEGIECTGFLFVDGIRFLTKYRCWEVKQYGPDHGHHPDPLPHPQPYENPVPGFLSVTDAIGRSCNVVFETLAHRMGLTELNRWFDAFGLGRPTGIGIAEARGRIPRPQRIPASQVRGTTIMAGIGQGEVTATPIQMANVAATIARNGMWMRPRLASAADAPPQPGAPPDSVKLPASDEAIAAVKLGMYRVVNSDVGTGKQIRRDDMKVSGKTGTAQAAKFTIRLRDKDGQLVEVDGRVQRQVFEPGAFDWYQGVGEHGTDVNHAWCIGYAPADQPRIAFCVLVEYGGSGGGMAGALARELLAACVEQGYLAPSGKF